MSDTSEKEIVLSGRQLERFEEIKEECKNVHVPAPSDEEMMKSLMDTWDAVGDDLYSDSDPADQSPEEAAFGHVRRPDEEVR